mgnify:CR=1 FL=1|jgi:hypothetical protein|tara:strand:- start:218 stop:451 length:234 start_codon:yes stop_codon:yes gene_type:complete
MSKTENQDTEISITDILQAHDILISMLLGKVLASSGKPKELISQIIQMTDVNDIGENSKTHIKNLLQPIQEALDSKQ